MKFNKLVPELAVSNLEKSIEFYTKALGFKIEYSREENSFVFLSFEGSQIMLEQINNKWDTGKLAYPFGRGINFQITVKNLDKIVKSLKANNYPIKMEPKDNWYRKGNKLLGNREILVMDPDGYLLRFSQDLGKKRKSELIQ
ncbi:MAG: VOC family protein [Candidatus Diapherotrites archaeon]|nr:VOC family protein [Candidatus Diapherotrites archaeon]